MGCHLTGLYGCFRKWEHLGNCRARDSCKSLHLPCYKKSKQNYAFVGLFFFVCSLTGGKTNQLILQNTATKAIIQGLIPDQTYALQIIAFSEDKESKPAQGQFRSMCLYHDIQNLSDI